MPPLPKLKVPALVRLEKLLLTRPRASVLKDLARAEELAVQVEAGVTYPEDWVAFRVTGATVSVAAPEMVMGQGLGGELAALVERVSAGTGMQAEDVAGGLDADELCARWRMSRQTLARLRRRGLAGWRVVGDDKRQRLIFSKSAVERFEQARKTEVSRSAGFSRVDPTVEAAMVKRAARYRRILGCSLSQAAARIAKRFGRSHEGVRQLLRRAHAPDGAALFVEAPPLDQRRREVVYRAWVRGVDLSLISRKTRRSRGAVRRAISMARADRLGALLASGDLEIAAVATGSRGGSAAVLSPPPVRTGLGRPWPGTIAAFLKEAGALGPPIGAEEKARLIAHRFLRQEAARVIGTLDRLHPAAGEIDIAETMLRWASRLKVELVRSQTRLVLEALHARLGRPVQELSGADAQRVLSGALRIVGDAVDAFDPVRGGRLAGAVGIAVDRYAVLWAKELAPVAGSSRRASTMIPAGLAMPDWTREVSPWQRVLEPDRRLRGAAESGKLARAHATLLLARYGWDGGPPRTLAELGADMKLSGIAIARMERKAVGEGLKVARGGQE